MGLIFHKGKVPLNEQGSYTVEAALIMSLLFVLLFLLCFSFMLMYKQVFLTKTAAVLARQYQMGQTGGAIKDTENIAVEVQKNSSLFTEEFKVTLRQEIKIPLGQLKKFFSGKETLQLSAEERAVRTRPAEFIRKTDLVLECIDRFRGDVNWGELGELWKGEGV